MKQPRPIRFKAKDIRTGEWVEGLYAIIYETITGDDGEPVGFRQYPSIYVIDEPWRPNGGHLEEVYPQTLCQFTGMVDNNNNNIWEGDIVYDPLMTAGNFMRVFWYEKYGCFKCYHPVHGVLPVQSESLEVVGNIFDDIEVLDSEYEPHEVRWMLEMKDL